MASVVAMPALLLPVEQLISSPSRREGVSPETETALRAWVCVYARQTAIALRLPCLVAATAQTIVQFFYYRASVRTFDPHLVALAAVWLAAKACEHPRAVGDVIIQGYAVRCRRLGAPVVHITKTGPVYARWKVEILKLERVILKETGFCIYTMTEHPHALLLFFLRALEADERVAQHAFNFVNDSLATDACVRFPAEAIACAAIALAAEVTEFPLPSPDADTLPWYVLFGTDDDALAAAVRHIRGVYKLPVAGWLPSLREGWTTSMDQDVQADMLHAQAQLHSADAAAAPARASVHHRPPVAPAPEAAITEAQPPKVTALPAHRVTESLNTDDVAAAQRTRGLNRDMLQPRDVRGRSRSRSPSPRSSRDSRRWRERSPRRASVSRSRSRSRTRRRSSDWSRRRSRSRSPIDPARARSRSQSPRRSMASRSPPHRSRHREPYRDRSPDRARDRRPASRSPSPRRDRWRP